MAANPIVVIGGSSILGGASGRSLQLKNFGPALLACVQVWVVTTATVGNRVFVLQVYDPAGNPLWSSTAPAVVPASTTARYSFGSGIQAAAAPTPGIYNVASISDQMILPPNSQIAFFDQAVIDANDSVPTYNALLSVGG